MKESIVNLTNNLIGEHKFNSSYLDFVKRPGDIGKFVEYVCAAIKNKNIIPMTDAKQGEIMGALESDYFRPDMPIPTYTPQKNPLQFQQEVLATFLAEAIYARLSGNPKVPPYKTSRSNVAKSLQPDGKKLLMHRTGARIGVERY